MWYRAHDVMLFDMTRPVDTLLSVRAHVGLAFESLAAGAGSRFYVATWIGEVAELRIDRAVPTVSATPTQVLATPVASSVDTATPSATATATIQRSPTSTPEVPVTDTPVVPLRPYRLWLPLLMRG